MTDPRALAALESIAKSLELLTAPMRFADARATHEIEHVNWLRDDRKRLLDLSRRYLHERNTARMGSRKLREKLKHATEKPS